MPIIPLWGIVARPDGALQCECGAEDCDNAGKHPRQYRWFNKGTQDPGVVAAWHRDWPRMNFGGLTGGNVLVVDVDPLDAKTWLEELEFAYGARIPYTVRSRSGRDGYGAHIYFKNLSPKIRSGKGAHPQIDIKAYHGYVVLSGSRHVTGRCYRWLEEYRPREVGDVAGMPEWLIRELQLKGPKMPKVSTDGGSSLSELERTSCKVGATPSDSDTEDKERLRKKYGVDVSSFVVRRNAATLDWKMDNMLSCRKTNHKRIMATWCCNRGPGTPFAFRDTTDSSYELALATIAACEKWTPQQTVDLLVRWRRKNRPGTRDSHRKRLESILLRAFLTAERRGLIRKKPGRPRSTKYAMSATAGPESKPEALELKEAARTAGMA